MTKELIEKIEDAHRRVWKIGPDAIYETELREVLRAAADALSARQPSEDDREATEAEIDKAARVLHMAKCCSLSGDSPHDFPEASELFAAGVVLNAVPRAAVPDAATEGDYHEGLEEGIKIGRAERDAALAAIGRIRQAVSGHPECDRYEEGDVISCGWKSAYASVVAALDGAPEPETPELFPGTNAALDRLTVRKAAPAEAFCIEHGNFHAVELGDPTCEFEDGFGEPVEGESNNA